jgi:hypothetical protein
VDSGGGIAPRLIPNSRQGLGRSTRGGEAKNVPSTISRLLSLRHIEKPWFASNGKKVRKFFRGEIVPRERFPVTEPPQGLCFEWEMKIIDEGLGIASREW